MKSTTIWSEHTNTQSCSAMKVLISISSCHSLLFPVLFFSGSCEGLFCSYVLCTMVNVKKKKKRYLNMKINYIHNQEIKQSLWVWNRFIYLEIQKDTEGELTQWGQQLTLDWGSCSLQAWGKSPHLKPQDRGSCNSYWGLCQEGFWDQSFSCEKLRKLTEVYTIISIYVRVWERVSCIKYWWSRSLKSLHFIFKNESRTLL